MISKTSFWTHYSEDNRIVVIGSTIAISWDYGKSYKADLGAKIFDLIENNRIEDDQWVISISDSNRGDPYRSGKEISFDHKHDYRETARIFLEDRDYEDFVQVALTTFKS